MTIQGDTSRPRSVKAEFDPEQTSTPRAGAVLFERVMRSLGVFGFLSRWLPSRSLHARYPMVEAVYGLIAGLLLGGRGLSAAEVLREDGEAARIFGLGKGVAEEATMNRVMGELAGLAPRAREEAYEEAGPRQPSMGLFGGERKAPRRRRRTPEAPEEAGDEARGVLEGMVTESARACLKALPAKVVRTGGFLIRFGDGTDLEVEGRCFDAARVGHTGKKHLRLVGLRLGPVTIAEEIGEGARGEAGVLTGLFGKAEGLTREIAGKKGVVLDLLDSAFLQKDVLERLWSQTSERFIIGANKMRNRLTVLAEEQPGDIWKETGPDESRGWLRGQVGVFLHRAEGWSRSVTIVARRWQEEGEMPGLWRYAFAATDLAWDDLPKTKRKRFGYARTVWMLYGLKQGCENHYKTLLSDFGMHHPPSSRLGVNQAFYAVAAVAVNIAMVIRYRVLPREERGMRFWRVRCYYARLAGVVTQSARQLLVRLAGGSVDEERQRLWMTAFRAAGGL